MYVIIYIHETFIYSPTWIKHLNRLDDVSRRLRNANLERSLEWDKTNYMGHMINQHRMISFGRQEKKEVIVVSKSPILTTMIVGRSFLRMVEYYKVLITELSKITN